MALRKLILFDLDGTLVAPGPVPRTALAEAISKFFGQSIELNFRDVAGFTDPTIIQNALVGAGYKGGVGAGEMTSILDHYLTLVEERLPGSNDLHVFPGAETLVRSCQQEGWVTALLTGNVARGARAKLARTGLWELFAFGVFGDDGNQREDLLWVARERAWDTLHEAFRPQDTILIGDTPNDARIARLNGVGGLVVCRRDEPDWRQAIEAERPTWLVDDFEDVPTLIKLMRGNFR